MRKYLNLRANIALGLVFAFLVNSLGPLPLVQAQEFSLPVPGVMVPLSPEFNPAILKGIKVHPDNPFHFEFILDTGDNVSLRGAQATKQSFIKEESTRLIKYFLASLTIPENDLWVNLSPYEKDRIIPNSFGLTEMGRDLLAEDYMLKQITASLIYPEGETGRKFWKRIYAEAYKKFGTTNIPVNTFNKVWIVPEKAVVYENAKAGTAYIVDSKLKVMLEQDYLSMAKHDCGRGVAEGGAPRRAQAFASTAGKPEDRTPTIAPSEIVNALGSQIVREIVIPELTREVNEGKNFAQLRQVYNSLILATWYKKKIKDSILEQVYADKKKVAGVTIDDPKETHRIYQRYLQAFKKGVYNYIKEDEDPLTQEPTPRKYFSGGVSFFGDLAMKTEENIPDSLPKNDKVISVVLNQAVHPQAPDKAKPRLLVMDDRQSHLDRIKAVLGSRYDITTALTLAEAENIINKSDTFDVVLSDLDLSNKLYTKFQKLDFQGKKIPIRKAGISFVQWLKQHNKAPAVIILHSTTFESVGFDRIIAALTGSNPNKIRLEMKKLGIFVQPKSMTFRGELPNNQAMRTGPFKPTAEVEARRLKELQILDQQKTPIVSSQLLELLKAQKGYNKVASMDVINDLRRDKRFKDHPKLQRTRDDQLVEKRRAKELEILDRSKKIITWRELHALLKSKPGFSRVQPKEVRNDIYHNEDLGGHQNLNVKRLAPELLEARRLKVWEAQNKFEKDKLSKELEILEKQKRPITVTQLFNILRGQRLFGRVTQNTVREDVHNNQALFDHRNMILAADPSARRSKELDILDRQKKPIDDMRLFELLNAENGFSDVKLEDVQQDVVLTRKLEIHPKLFLEGQESKLVKARRAAEFEVLEKQKEPITTRQLFEILKRRKIFSDVSFDAIKIDITRLSYNANVKRSEFNGLGLINDLGNPFNPDNTNGVWEKVSPAEVRLKFGTFLDRDAVRKVAKDDFVKLWTILQKSYNKIRLSEHPNRNKRNVDSQSIKARRDLAREILDQQKEPITFDQLFKLLKSKKGFEDTREDQFKHEVDIGRPLRNHPKLKVIHDSILVKERRAKELEILNKQTTPITPEQLLDLLKAEQKFNSMKLELLSNDIGIDQPLRKNPMLKMVRDIKLIKKRRAKIQVILNRQESPVGTNQLFDFLKAEEGYGSVTKAQFLHDVYTVKKLKNHPKVAFGVRNVSTVQPAVQPDVQQPKKTEGPALSSWQTQLETMRQEGNTEGMLQLLFKPVNKQLSVTPRQPLGKGEKWEVTPELRDVLVRDVMEPYADDEKKGMAAGYLTDDILVLKPPAKKKGVLEKQKESPRHLSKEERYELIRAVMAKRSGINYAMAAQAQGAREAINIKNAGPNEAMVAKDVTLRNLIEADIKKGAFGAGSMSLALKEKYQKAGMKFYDYVRFGGSEAFDGLYSEKIDVVLNGEGQYLFVPEKWFDYHKLDDDVGFHVLEFGNRSRVFIFTDKEPFPGIEPVALEPVPAIRDDFAMLAKDGAMSGEIQIDPQLKSWGDQLRELFLKEKESGKKPSGQYWEIIEDISKHFNADGSSWPELINVNSSFYSVLHNDGGASLTLTPKVVNGEMVLLSMGTYLLEKATSIKDDAHAFSNEDLGYLVQLMNVYNEEMHPIIPLSLPSLFVRSTSFFAEPSKLSSLAIQINRLPLTYRYMALALRSHFIGVHLNHGIMDGSYDVELAVRDLQDMIDALKQKGRLTSFERQAVILGMSNLLGFISFFVQSDGKTLKEWMGKDSFIMNWDDDKKRSEILGRLKNMMTDNVHDINSWLEEVQPIEKFREALNSYAVRLKEGQPQANRYLDLEQEDPYLMSVGWGFYEYFQEDLLERFHAAPYGQPLESLIFDIHNKKREEYLRDLLNQYLDTYHLILDKWSAKRMRSRDKVIKGKSMTIDDDLKKAGISHFKVYRSRGFYLMVQMRIFLSQLARSSQTFGSHHDEHGNRAILNNGGIDLNAINKEMQVQSSGEGIKFHLDAAQMAQLQNATGFVPVIINIQPMTDLRAFLVNQ